MCQLALLGAKGLKKDEKKSRWSVKLIETNILRPIYSPFKTPVDQRSLVDMKTGELKSWTGARRPSRMKAFTITHAHDLILARTPW